VQWIGSNRDGSYCELPSYSCIGKAYLDGGSQMLEILEHRVKKTQSTILSAGTSAGFQTFSIGYVLLRKRSTNKSLVIFEDERSPAKGYWRLAHLIDGDGACWKRLQNCLRRYRRIEPSGPIAAWFENGDLSMMSGPGGSHH
jgi:hypothetical protein